MSSEPLTQVNGASTATCLGRLAEGVVGGSGSEDEGHGVEIVLELRVTRAQRNVGLREEVEERGAEGRVRENNNTNNNYIIGTLI